MTSIDPPLRGTAMDLLDWMDEIYPARFPGRHEAPEDWHRAAGARELIDGLLALREAMRGSRED